jgi:putative flippase GtrA
MKSADNGQGGVGVSDRTREDAIVTCTPALDRSATPADGAPSQAPQPPRSRRRDLHDWLRRDDVFAQLVRFALVGGISSSFYALLFWSLERFGSQQANVIAVVLSSILANDLHRRLTFHAERRLSWLMAQWEGGGVSLIALVATTVALGWLDHAVPDPGVLLELALVGVVFAVIGCLRFVALRWLFLLRHPNRA